MRQRQTNPWGTWNDLVMDSTDQRAASAPTFADFGSGVFCNRLDAGQNDEVHMTAQLSHSISGSPQPVVFSPHCHLMPTVNVLPAHTIRLQWIYFFCVIGEVKPAAQTDEILFTGLTIPANTHYIFEMTDFAPASWSISTIIVSRFSRRSQGGGDSYPGNLWLLGVDWHFRSNWPGGTYNEYGPT